MILILLFCIQISDAEKLMTDRILGIAANEGYSAAVHVLAAEYGMKPYEFGNNLAQRQNRPKTAATWFEGLINEIDAKEDYRFGKAWSLWMNQDVKGAFKEVGGLLVSKDKVIKARANYLVGLIHLRLVKPQIAETHFLNAIEIYQSIKYYGGVYASCLELAYLYANKNMFAEARELISKAEQANELMESELHLKPNHLGRISSTRFFLAFRQGAYGEAIRWAEAAIAPYEGEGNRSDAGLCRIRAGLCYAFLGRMDKAEEIAKVVDTYANKNNLGKVAVYNLLIWIYISRCRGLDTELFEREIKEWSDNHDDPWLIDVMTSIAKVACPQ